MIGRILFTGFAGVDKSKMKKLFKVTFTVVCVSLALYTTVLQMLRLQLNEDVSSITFRQFNEDAKHQYPTITFCIVRFGTCVSKF